MTSLKAPTAGRSRTVARAAALTVTALLILGACGSGGEDRFEEIGLEIRDGGNQQGSFGGVGRTRMADEPPGTIDGGLRGWDDADPGEGPAEQNEWDAADSNHGEDGYDQGEAGLPDRPLREVETHSVTMSALDLGRSIVYTATIDLAVENVVTASRQAQQAVAAAGGVLFSQDTTTDPRPRSVLVFKVSPEGFNDAMERLEALGTVTNQDISADDVTARVVDLQSRILTAEVSVERLRGLLDSATTVESIAALEGQLLDRESNLELLRGQLRTIQNQVALATITVNIAEIVPPGPEPAITVAVTGYVSDDGDGDRCPGERRLSVDENDAVVVCVSVLNTGNVPLKSIEVRDAGLDLRREDWTILNLGDDEAIAPGESVVAWATFDAALQSYPQPTVSAIPIGDDGEVLRQATQVTDDPIALDVIKDDSLPGFWDSMGFGLGTLSLLGSTLLVVVGTLAPFAIVFGPAAALYLWWRRRNGKVVRYPDPPAPAPSSI